jgi:hypothetical protein
MAQFYFRTPFDIPFTHFWGFAIKQETGFRDVVHPALFNLEQATSFFFNRVLAALKGDCPSVITAFPAGYSVLRAI